MTNTPLRPFLIQSSVPHSHLSKEVADAGCTNTHKHLHKLRGIQRQEGYASLPRHCPSQQCLPRACKYACTSGMMLDCRQWAES